MRKYPSRPSTGVRVAPRERIRQIPKNGLGSHSTSGVDWGQGCLDPCSLVTIRLTLFGSRRRAALFLDRSPDQTMFVSGAPDRLGPSSSSQEGIVLGNLIYRQEAT